MPQVDINFALKGQLDKLEQKIEKSKQRILRNVSKLVNAKYKDYTKQYLTSTRDEFLNNLDVNVVTNGVRVTIEGWLPTALDLGHDSFDMKPGLLQGRSSRVIPMADGGFRTVSTRSPEDAWIHPGFDGFNFSKMVAEDVENQFEEIATTEFGRSLA